MHAAALLLQLEVTKTCILSCLSSNFGQMEPMTMELDLNQGGSSFRPGGGGSNKFDHFKTHALENRLGGGGSRTPVPPSGSAHEYPHLTWTAPTDCSFRIQWFFRVRLHLSPCFCFGLKQVFSGQGSNDLVP